MEFFEALKQMNYEHKSGLDYINEFTFIVGIILSAQSKDSFINSQTKEFFQNYETSEKMQELGIGGIEQYINKIGLWRNKAKNIYKLSEKISKLKKFSKTEAENWHSGFENNDFHDDLKIYGSEILSKEGIPSFRAGLLYLDGIGRKSANAFLNIIYDAPTIVVDTHVLRLTKRLNLSFSDNPFEVEKDLHEIVPEKYKKYISSWLVWHGRTKCFARKPNCTDCLLKEYCNYENKEL